MAIKEVNKKSASAHLCTTCQKLLILRDGRSQICHFNANQREKLPSTCTTSQFQQCRVATGSHCTEKQSTERARGLLRSAGKSLSPGLLRSHLKLLGKWASDQILCRELVQTKALGKETFCEKVILLIWLMAGRKLFSAERNHEDYQMSQVKAWEECPGSGSSVRILTDRHQ